MSISVLDRRSSGTGKPVAISELPKRFFTPQEYLAIERLADFKSEYYRGEMIPMPGASLKHNELNSDLAYLLKDELKGLGWRILHSDMRVRVPATDLYTYPDIVGIFGKPITEEVELDVLLNPTLIVEILSKSTASYDRGRKFDQYRTIESLREYLLLSQDHHYAERFTRQPDDTWSLTVFEGADGILELTTPQVKIPLAKIYANVEIGESE